LSFHYLSGVETVDDLLERIDEAIEKAKIVVNSGQEKPANKPADAEKKPDDKPKGDEPIRVPYGDMHKIEDLLALVNNQPGKRKVVLEGAPAQANSGAAQKSSNPPPAGASPAANNDKPDSATTEKKTETPSASTTEKKTEGPSATTTEKKTDAPSASSTEKKTETPSASSTEKKTETPSASTTEKKTETPSAASTEKKTETPSATTTVKQTATPSSTKTTEKTTEKQPAANDSSPTEQDQIHVNIQDVKSVDDLLDRIDQAVQKVPIVIDTTPRDKNQGLFIII
jgi:hypothetical protein